MPTSNLSKKNKVRKSKKSKLSTKNRSHKICVIIYNINYWDKDGDKIANNSFSKKYKDYQYNNGQSGSYGLYQEYMVPSNKLSKFKSDIKSFHKKLHIKNLKIIISMNKNYIDKKLHLLDKDPN